MKFLSYKEEGTGPRAFKRQHSVDSVNSDDNKKPKTEKKSQDVSDKQKTCENNLTAKNAKKSADKKDRSINQTEESATQTTSSSSNTKVSKVNKIDD